MLERTEKIKSRHMFKYSPTVEVNKNLTLSTSISWIIYYYSDSFFLHLIKLTLTKGAFIVCGENKFYDR